MARPRKAVLKVATDALTLGRECISEGDAVPFILLRGQGSGEHLIDFVSASGVIDEDHLAAARKMIRQMSEKMAHYAFIYHGTLTINDQQRPAVFAEVGMQGDSSGFLFAQKYKRRKRGGLFPEDGEVLLLDAIEHLWTVKRRRK